LNKTLRGSFAEFINKEVELWPGNTYRKFGILLDINEKGFIFKITEKTDPKSELKEGDLYFHRSVTMRATQNNKPGYSIDVESFLDGCETCCFNCADSDPMSYLTKISRGVVLCSRCLSQAEIDYPITNNRLLRKLDEER